MIRRWWIALVIVLLAVTLRGLWLTADPPTTHGVGVVWHDEGAWTHNARNQALIGQWRTDAWNPMFIAPVFTALEYISFEAFGVGTWQARMVPLISGLLAIIALMAGLSAVAGRRAALMGGVLLATNYTFVMWNRAALMESTMTAFIVISWAAYARASSARSRARVTTWGLLGGAAAVAAFFTKAAAAFYIAALVLELATSWYLSRQSSDLPSRPAAQLPILAGLCLATLAALAVFVIPNWTEFRFYNWEMTVTRKPTYTLEALTMRASWLPVVQETFTRMWLVLLAGSVSALAIVSQWRQAHPAARLAVLWLLIGLAELVVHDSGSERRYVMFIPGLIALAALTLEKTSGAFFRDGVEKGTRRPFRLPSLPASHLPSSLAVSSVAGVLTYLVAGSLLRLVWMDQVAAQDYSTTVRVSAGIAVLAAGVAWFYRARLTAWLQQWRLPALAAAGIVLVTSGTDLTLYARWAPTRTFLNHDASRMLAGILPPGTLVHGKLANGLALENGITPLFVGRGFGNYADRLDRDDARYILTYTIPEPGYEGDVILDVLERYPQRRVIIEFDVQETSGPDRAALIDKFPDGPETRARNR